MARKLGNLIKELYEDIDFLYLLRKNDYEEGRLKEKIEIISKLESIEREIEEQLYEEDKI